MRRQTVPIIAGLVLALFGTALVTSYVRGVERRAADGGTVVTVWVASKTISAGTPGSALDGVATRRSTPRRYAPPGALSDVASVRGMFALERIEPGETILARQFGSSASTRGQLAVPKGKEAVSVSIPIDAGLAQYAQPGDRVSVYATFKGPNPTTTKILSGVEVLATEARQRTASPGGGADLIVVLAVTPFEASALVFGQEIGSVWLTLVPQGQISPAVPPVSLLPDAKE